MLNSTKSAENEIQRISPESLLRKGLCTTYFCLENGQQWVRKALARQTVSRIAFAINPLKPRPGADP